MAGHRCVHLQCKYNICTPGAPLAPEPLRKTRQPLFLLLPPGSLPNLCPYLGNSSPPLQRLAGRIQNDAGFTGILSYTADWRLWLALARSYLCPHQRSRSHWIRFENTNNRHAYRRNKCGCPGNRKSLRNMRGNRSDRSQCLTTSSRGCPSTEPSASGF